MNRLSSALSLWLGLVALSTAAAAQGTDTCTTPTAIAGVGGFAFNTTTATTGTQGQASPLCNQSGQIGIDRDVWFAWTAPATDTFTINVCGASFDTKLAVHAGSGCPAGVALVCDDDACPGLQSSVVLSATSGAVYTIQLGSFPGVAGGSGTLTIATIVVVPCPTPSTGPDVIVGDLNGVANYGVTGGLDAISLGTTSCNIGTVNLNWIAGNQNHPVIGGNLYRYRVVAGSGRFEQIGMSWLKHGFFALSEELCCTGCAATDGTSLGVKCSDPYTPSRNGGQTSLGPRSQVNAHTGAFTYPPANPSWSGTAARRCEFLVSDVDTSAGVRYFGEGQYVTPDDAAAGNQNNNASYRELSVNGAGTDFSPLGETQRMLAAINAWKVVDPAVVLTNVQVAGDGLFVVGYKTTSLGGGQYHYEYAVYNMNADRCGGSFSVPLPASATITNVGFRDVTYRNGDGPGNVNYSGTDWTVTQTSTSIKWACETQAVNASANALRWGTLYNFRFDANAAPMMATATLGLWKPGTPTSVGVNVEIPSGASSFVYCAGDGTGTACPCANNSGVGNGEGCLNSTGLGGKLRATGVASIAADTLVLQGSKCLPFGPGLYFQGSAQVASGTVFGNGLLCLTGATPRLEIRLADGTGASATTVAIHTLGSATAGNVRNYQLWYRDGTGFCVGAAFNVSNAVSLTWIP